MTLDLLTALATFAFVTVMTPGPNNLMLMASGTNFGFSRSIPHMLGVGLGFPLMVAFVGLGVMQVFDLWPLSYTLLKIGSVAYLVYLAWKIANAAPPRDAEASGKPLTFLQSAAFQWVNPKAWSMALSAITLYATGRDLASVLWVAGVYVAVSMVSTTSWTLLGQQLRRLLKNQTRLRIFNWIMASLLIATLIPVLWPT
ncbi:Transporter, LysE family protein [Roseovarius sp. EC-HK134]|uniref:LysE family translocator n=1 Tax=Roseovarius TaxID=74030 RepID=UPI0001556B0C|nr:MULTISPECIES: LysE family translocator [unclassified Roseovarius]AWZ22576.1 Transporter, LysE family [Roseovarius sp. AK1035]EDM32307.1 transporter, LysE family protein [Roseovarius sp. TM1035]VVT33329.1 Transporter, LysE family protein [Roseovarius sp. EC-SD190]VVT33479.1 Transporter, LysE family protein [Roseovarius sp. EC-HK134]|tara:strand:- start:1039 stop:1635 length:597 start_codon:yes stop_codon:yes gene_type:complete